MKLTNELSNQIIDEMENAKDFIDISEILKKYSKYELKGAQLGRAFEKMFVQPNGFSSNVSMDELEKYHHSFHTTNGGDWCRSNQSYLGKKYNIERENRGGRIFAVKCDGFNIVQNNGECAGQTVFHFHMHLIPRYDGEKTIIDWDHKEFSDDEMKAICNEMKL